MPNVNIHQVPKFVLIKHKKQIQLINYKLH
jgi:hypothetical protein